MKSTGVPINTVRLIHKCIVMTHIHGAFVLISAHAFCVWNLWIVALYFDQWNHLD